MYHALGCGALQGQFYPKKTIILQLGGTFFITIPAMLNATVDIVNANRERYPDLSEREIMDRQYKVKAGERFGTLSQGGMACAR